tara:strand:- start:640 stop:1311 length:672 start_codon:yes stop_codon:yes gene_type:complete
MKAMILAAGFGKRLLPLTEVTPKPLLMIGKKTLIERNIEYLLNNGFSEIVINVSHLSEQIIEHVNEKFPDIKINFSVENKPLGTGGGIQNAIPVIGSDPFLCVNADIFHEIKINDLSFDVEAAHLIGVPNPEHNKEGDFSINNGVVVVNEIKNMLTWSGISVINPKIFSDIQSRENSFNMWDAVLPKYIKKGIVTGHLSKDTWIDVGTIDRLKLANSVYNDQN